MHRLVAPIDIVKVEWVGWAKPGSTILHWASTSKADFLEGWFLLVSFVTNSNVNVVDFGHKAGPAIAVKVPDFPWIINVRKVLVKHVTACNAGVEARHSGL